MNRSPLWRTLFREFRGSRGRAALICVSLALGVTAVVAIASLVASIEEGLRSQSRALLGGDFAVSARRPLPPELSEWFESRPGTVRADLLELSTMARTSRTEGQTASRLVELKVVRGEDYPLYGEFALTPTSPLNEVLDANTVAVAPELLDALDLEVGERIEIGKESFAIGARIEEEPDRLEFSMALTSPRVLMGGDAFDRTGLLQFGSRVRYKALFRLPNSTAEELSAIEERLASDLEEAPYLRFESHTKAQPSVRRALGRVESTLGLIALLSLLLGGVGVAQVIRSWLAGRVLNIAILRCLGFRPVEIVVLYAAQIGMLALVGSALGGFVGASLPLLLGRLVPDAIPDSFVLGLQPGAFAKGVFLGLTTALAFGVPPLLAVHRVSPARVLRHDAEPLSPRTSILWGGRLFLLLGVFLSSWVQAGNLGWAAWFTGGLFLVTATLYAGAQGLVWFAGRIPRERFRPTVRNGISALGRPGAGTTGAILALGVGVLVLFAVFLIERGLRGELRTALPSSSPSLFLVDVQTDQWPTIETMLEEREASAIRCVPVVTARLSEVNGRKVAELAEEAEAAEKTGGDRRVRWVLTREQRMTWAEELSEDNRILEGEFSSDPDRNEVSVEEEFARDLGVGIGSELRFDLQGVPLDLTVSSIRSVEWQSFGINFFLVVEPGVLENAPQFRLAAARLPKEREQEFQDSLTKVCPNVVILRVRSILERLLSVLTQLSLGVRTLGAFTILTGIAILAGAVSSTNARRGREAALLKTLGVTRLGVVALFATEYALWGAVAGVIGAGGALVLADSFLRYVLEVEPTLPWATVPVVIGATVGLAVVSGVMASARAISVRPLLTLRS